MYDCFHGFPVHDVHENGDAHGLPGLHDYVDNDVPHDPGCENLHHAHTNISYHDHDSHDHDPVVHQNHRHRSLISSHG